MDASQALPLATLVTLIVAFIKGLYPGDMPPRAVFVLVAAISLALVGLAVYSGALSGTPLDLVGQWVYLAAGAVGIREGVTNIVPAASSLTSRQPRA